MMREYFRQREQYEWKQDGVSVQDKFASELCAVDKAGLRG